MCVDIKINERITVTIVTVGRSAFEGGGQDQIATVWGDDREIIRLERHRSSKRRGYFAWHPWYELKWTGTSHQPMGPALGGLLEVVGVVNDMLEGK